MTNATTRRGLASWTVALLAAALAALLMVTLGGTAKAQATGTVDLDVQKTVYPRTVQVGELQTFTIKVRNDGTIRAEGVRMRDPLPSKVRFVRASTSRQVPGSCGIDNRVVVCRLGTLRPDETVTVKIYVRPVVAGSYTNRAYASYTDSVALERNASDNSDAARAVVE